MLVSNLSLTLRISFYQSGVRLMRGVVKEVHPKKIVLSDGNDVPYGLLVWSTGVGPSEFVKSLNLPKSPGGRYIHVGCSRRVALFCSLSMLQCFDCFVF